MHAGGDASGLGLQCLRAADFTAVCGDRRIKRHILRQRRHRIPLPREHTRHNPATKVDLPASEVVPCTIKQACGLLNWLRGLAMTMQWNLNYKKRVGAALTWLLVFC